MIIWKCFCGNILLHHSEWEVPVLIYLKHFFAILSHHSNKIVAKYVRDHFSVVKYIHTYIRDRSRDITSKYLCFKRLIRLFRKIKPIQIALKKTLFCFWSFLAYFFTSESLTTAVDEIILQVKIFFRWKYSADEIILQMKIFFRWKYSLVQHNFQVPGQQWHSDKLI